MNKIFAAGFVFMITATSFDALAFNPNIDGIWKKACTRYGDDDDMKAELVIKKNQWELAYIAFEDSTCQVPYLKFSRYFEIKIDHQNLILQAAKTTYTALSKETAEALRLAVWCGKSDWQKDVVVDVTGLDCGDYHAQNQGQMTYSIFEISPDGMKINLGERTIDNDGSTESKRHRNLEREAFAK